jgi:hypothetical protein
MSVFQKMLAGVALAVLWPGSGMAKGAPLPPGKTQRVRLHGRLSVTNRHGENVMLKRTIFPCVDAPTVVDGFHLQQPVTVKPQ